MVDATFTKVVQRRKDLRFPLPEAFAKRLTGRRIVALDRRAKYLLARLDSNEILTMHLGMSGRFLIQRPGANAQKTGEFLHEAGGTSAHDHIVFEMSNGTVVRFNDARRFGYMDIVAADELMSHKHFRGLGVEPLGAEFTPDYLAEQFSGKKTPLKAALLDQRIIAGLGNIYVCEALHRAGLSPKRNAGTLSNAMQKPGLRANRLVQSVQAVLEDAIEAGGSSLRDYRTADGESGYFQHAFSVYARAGQNCLRQDCSGAIRRIVQSGRSTFYCPSCQR